MLETKILDPSKWSENYTNQLFAFAYTRTQNQALSEDLVQDTFFSALKAKDKFKGNSSEKTWLYSILKNKIIDYYRKSSTKKEKNILDDDDNFNDAFFLNDGHWKDSQGFITSKDEASKLIENEQFYKILDNCLNNLPAKTKLAFRMKHIEGFETGEVCNELDISTSNYWVLLHRARVSLRNCLIKNKVR